MSKEFEKPQSRNEAILQNMLGAENKLPEPISRIEVLLLQVLDLLNDLKSEDTGEEE